jgi:hypothetical protein
LFHHYRKTQTSSSLFDSKHTTSKTEELNSGSSSRLIEDYDLMNDDENGEMIELEIPIKIVRQHSDHSSAVHRNEKYILVNNELERQASQHMSKFNAHTNDTRRYLNDRLNSFEAEITFYNLADNGNCVHTKTPRLVHRFRSQQPVTSYHSCHCCGHHYHHHHHNVNHHCVSSRHNYHHSNSNIHTLHKLDLNSSSCSSTSNSSSGSANEPSVTNLMLMQIIDGRLIE